MSIKIREAARKDYLTMALIWDIAQAARRQEPLPNMPTAETLNIIAKRGNDASLLALVAEDQHKVVGSASAVQARKQDKTNTIIPGLLISVW